MLVMLVVPFRRILIPLVICLLTSCGGGGEGSSATVSGANSSATGGLADTTENSAAGSTTYMAQGVNADGVLKLATSADRVFFDNACKSYAEFTVPAALNGIDTLVIAVPPNEKKAEWLNVFVIDSRSKFHLHVGTTSVDSKPTEDRSATLRLIGLMVGPTPRPLEEASLVGYVDVQVSYRYRDQLRITAVGPIQSIDSGSSLTNKPVTTFRVEGRDHQWKLVNDDGLFVFRPRAGVGPTTVEVYANGQHPAGQIQTGLGNIPRVDTWTVSSTECQHAGYFARFEILGRRLRVESESGLPVSQAILDYRPDLPAPVLRYKVLASDGTALTWRAQVGPDSPLVLDRTGGRSGDILTVSIDPARWRDTFMLFDDTVYFDATANGVSYDGRFPVRFDRPRLEVGYSHLIGGALKTDLVASTVDERTLEWRVSRKPDWLQISPATGIAGAFRSELTLSPDRSVLPFDTTSDTFELTALDRGRELKFSFPVTVVNQNLLIRPSDQVIALVQTSNQSRLSYDLRVTDNYWLPTRVVARSDQPWLKIESSATLGAPVRLTADPSGLTPGALYSAKVTIVGAPGSLATGATVAVSFWFDPASATGPRSFSGPFRNVIADRLRPVVYAHDGVTLRAIQVYTGAVLASLTGLGNSLANMTLSEDATKLYVRNEGNPGRIIGVNLPALQRSGEDFAGFGLLDWQGPYVTKPGFDSALQLYGNFLITSPGSWDLSTPQAPLYEPSRFRADHYATDPASHRLASVGLNPALPQQLTLAVIASESRFTNGQGPAWPEYYYPVDAYSNGLDLALAKLGSATYLTGLNDTGCGVADDLPAGFLGSLRPIAGVPNNVEVGNDGTILCGVDVTQAVHDVWVFNGDRSLRGSLRLAGGSRLRPRSLTISADSNLVAAITTDGALRIAPLSSLAPVANQLKAGKLPGLNRLIGEVILIR